MKHIVLSIFVLIILLNIIPASAQEPAKKDPDFTFYSWEDNFLYKGKPSIELTYGQSEISLKNYGQEFPLNGTINLKLGWHKERILKQKNIVKYRSNYLGGSYTTSNIRFSNSTGGVPATINFGFGSSDGYGYKLGKNSSLILYNSSAMTWTRYNAGNSFSTIGIEDFHKSIRFGSTAEGGLIIPLGGLVNLQASYDRTIVFPRHMVWKHLGSAIIEAGGQSLIDGFVHAIYKSSPFAAPIVSFILKNGFAYGLYELRREKMNWPFESAEPLLFDTYKVGLKFTF